MDYANCRCNSSDLALVALGKGTKRLYGFLCAFAARSLSVIADFFRSVRWLHTVCVFHISVAGFRSFTGGGFFFTDKNIN